MRWRPRFLALRFGQQRIEDTTHVDDWRLSIKVYKDSFWVRRFHSNRRGVPGRIESRTAMERYGDAWNVEAASFVSIQSISILFVENLQQFKYWNVFKSIYVRLHLFVVFWGKNNVMSSNFLSHIYWYFNSILDNFQTKIFMRLYVVPFGSQKKNHLFYRFF